MTTKIEIKIEPQDAESDEHDGMDSNLNLEQPGCSLNPVFNENFVGIKQEVPDIQIKLEPLEEPHDEYETSGIDPEMVLMKLEHHMYESDETIKLPRARVVNYKEDDSDEEYLPHMKTVKRSQKKYRKQEPNVKPLLKSRPRTDEQTYSEEVTSNIEIVTIDEQARQAEHEESVRARKHMNYTCELCAVGFVIKEAYDMHLKMHSPEAGAEECDICKLRLKTQDMLYQHKLRHYRRYRCSICRFLQKDKDTVAAHIMSEHTGTAFVCQHCGRDYKRPAYLSRHIKQMHTKPIRLECPVCQRVFHERGWYRCHVRTHNEQVKRSITRKVTCAHCGRDFRNKSYLIRHLFVHEDKRPATCQVCSRTFKNSEVLRVHIRQHHGHNPPRDYSTDGLQSTRLPRFGADTTCVACGRILTTPAMLNRHMQRMHTERIKRFQCDYCQRCYYSKAEVRAHIEWTHLQQRKHACACGRVFRSPALLQHHALTRHLNIHQPKDKSCTVCGKMFANQQVLTRHVKSHSGETYPCTECGQKFKTQSYVKVHYKIKHLNMTRAQVKAQSRRKLIMIHNEEPIKAKIKSSKKSKLSTVDPLNLDNFEAKMKQALEKDVKKEVLDPPVAVPLFETFVDIQREC
ncbi:gastrula zinc finger protein XlCGF57.1-like isoform X3 [Maniola hyperantus]|uniref:gastrula zinc finger protein XlCGF57.1-like isoform X3 n=1 Tax=Aphantopus hyperantus TaxID=2795564 RepID=UPI0015687D47|nr:oocyte zinc finger protein XlCOF6-like isoform X1 [Maniola hyperantus]